jgi:hypothetical protein
MNRLFGLAALILLGALVAPSIGAEGKEDKKKPPAIADIMRATHRGPTSQLGKAKAALKDKDFDDLAAAAKKMVQAGGDLSRNKPPRGSAKDWKSLTATYVKNAKALEKAATDKNEGRAAKSLKTIETLCAKCHTAHKMPDE